MCEKSNTRPTISMEPWQTTVPIEGFTPNDMMIYLQGRTVVINGRQSQGDEETGIVSKEFKRKITLPNNFVIPSLDIGFEDGSIVISGQRRVIKRNDETPKQVAESETSKRDDTEIAVNISKKDHSDANEEKSLDSSKCDQEKNCENCDCSKSSSSDEVIMEDLGPEEEDGCQMEVYQKGEEAESKNEVESQTAKEVSKEVSKDVSKEVSTDGKHQEASKETSTEICEYKPMTWSIPFEGFDASDVKVHLEDDVVRVLAEHKDEQDGMTFFRRMERSFTLPKNVDSETLSSRFNTEEKKLKIEVMPHKKSSE